MKSCCGFPFRMVGYLMGGVLALIGLGLAVRGQAEEVNPRVLDAEAKRIAVVAKVRPSVVAIFSPGGQGGGSGVLIDKDGFALTNFHVVEGAGPVMQCGLDDGVLYDAVLVGLDKVGDVALVKLLPKKEGDKFPFAKLGDSDKVKAGDWSLAMGNPFLLATDFQPTVTFGLISGVHRYQYPAGTLLEYTDCIQIDTSINPGNSGGPLFNMDGELIGINGRGSFEKRGRVNSGVGYAISINQIKNFMGNLRAGIDTDHATLGAVIRTESDDDGNNRLVVTSIIENSDARRRGLDEGDEIVAFAGRPVLTVNQYKNVLGLYPKGWRVPLVYRRNNEKKEILVRLMQLQTSQSPDGQAKPRPRPGPPRKKVPARFSPASKLYEPKAGFANYLFNKRERDRLLAAFRKHGDFSAATGDWSFEAEAADARGAKSDVKLNIREEMADRGPDGKPTAEGTYFLNVDALPILPAPEPGDEKVPLRVAVRKAAGLLRQNAKSFPQEVWAAATDAETKQHVLDMQKDVSAIQAKLHDALEELNKLKPDRAKEATKKWQAQCDYTVGKLSSFLAYVEEYNFLLAQLRKDPPKRDPKLHRGWRMVPEETLQSGATAKKLAADAAKIWDTMSQDKELKATRWEEWIQKAKSQFIGVKWIPTGGTKTVVRFNLGAVKYELDPLRLDQSPQALQEPQGSGGLLAALYQYRRLLTLGQTGFEARFDHGGDAPFYPPPSNGTQSKTRADSAVNAELLVTEHNGVVAKWFFSKKDATLLGFEAWVDPEGDPCEVYFSDYRPEDSRNLPHRMDIVYGNDRFTTLTMQKYQIRVAK